MLPMKHLLTHRALPLAAVFIAVAGAGWSAPAPKSGVITYDMKQSPRGRPPQTVHQTIWFKGEQFRAETNTPSGKFVNINRPDGRYTIRPNSNEAMKTPVPPRPPNAPSRPAGIPGVGFGDVSMIQKHWKKVGSETVGRYKADIYESPGANQIFRPPSGKAGAPPRKMPTFTLRVWVSPTLPIPVKTTMKGPNFESEMVLKSAKLDVPVADSLFQLPKGTKIVPAPTPGMMGRPGPGGPRPPGQPMPPR